MTADMVSGLRLVLALGALMSVAAAQSSYDSPQFFLQALGDRTSLIPVTNEKSVTLQQGDLHAVATDDPAVERPSYVELRFHVVENTVSITVTAFFGGLPYQDPPASDVRSQILVTRSFKLNDAVSFPELTRMGASLDLRLVSAQPDRPYSPRLTSEAPSLTFEFRQIDRIMGTVTVHNRSDKAVVGFMFGVRGGQGELPQAEPGRTLIAPGGTYQYDSDAPVYGWCIGRVCGPEPLPLILREAIFADGSHEGDEIEAMQQSANWFGRAAEWKQIVSAGSSIMSDRDLDELGKIRGLASIIDGLSPEPDGDTLARFHTQFPDLPPNEMERGEELVAMWMRSERGDIKWRLDSREEDLRRKTQSLPPITEWWNHYAGK
jgi:hypothetical protein